MSAPQFPDDFYYLHVLPDGTEEREPMRQRGKPSLHVRVMLNYEETKTGNRLVWHDGMRLLQQLPSPPPGEGWVEQRWKLGIPTDVTVWRRPRR